MKFVNAVCLALPLGLAMLPAHAKPKDVTITNDFTSPVPVEEAFVREPFAFSGSDRVTSSFIAFQIDVPADRILVIESVGAQIEARSSSLTQMEVNYTSNGARHDYPLPTVEHFEGSFAAHENLRLYLDPGTSVRIEINQGFVEPMFAKVAVSGYLIDPLSPSLAP